MAKHEIWTECEASNVFSHLENQPFKAAPKRIIVWFTGSFETQNLSANCLHEAKLVQFQLGTLSSVHLAWQFGSKTFTRRAVMADKSLPNTGKLTLLGIAMVIIGTICCVSPAVAGGAVTYVIGFLLLATGFLQLFQGWRETGWTSKLLPIVLGILTVIAGGAILAHPWIGMSVLTIVLALSFLCDGVWKIVASFSFRPASGWLGLLLSGIIALVLGGMIWTQWPESSLYAIGILIGINLLMTGIAMIFLAVTVRKLNKQIAGTSPN
jgi:uncharacterized membrane protein HdeD (DUF308 family)